MAQITPADPVITATCGISIHTVQRRNRRGIAAFLAGLLSFGLVTAVQARPGDLDSSFDADGKVLTHFDGFDEASALVAQADGKLVAAGTTHTRNGQFALARYRPSGQLDRGFGRNGLVRTGIGAGIASAAALAIQIDGKLVAAGSASADGSFFDFALARYNPDGSLDPSFGFGGQVLTDLGGSDRLNALALQPDGKIVAAGLSGNDFALVRYNPDGTLDPGFGSGGRVLTDFGGLPEKARALVLQADGKIVAAGSTSTDFALARYNPDGSLDSGFGSGGRILTDLGGTDDARALVLQADGKIVAAGTPSRLSLDLSGLVIRPRPLFALVRYNVDGSRDATFGTAGVVFSSFDDTVPSVNPPIVIDITGRRNINEVNASINALVLQADGKLVAVGTSDGGAPSRRRICFGDSCRPLRDTDFALARYLVTDVRPRLPPRCGGRRATILGTARSDTIRGTAARDVILGLGGSDRIRGLEGNDIICGGPGNDMLLGNEGDDRLLGESGNDRLFGDKGGNILDGGTGRDSCKPNRGSNRCETQDATRPRDPPKPTVPTCSPVTNVPCVER